MREIPETVVCRILLFMWSFGALYTTYIGQDQGAVAVDGDCLSLEEECCCQDRPNSTTVHDSLRLEISKPWALGPKYGPLVALVWNPYIPAMYHLKIGTHTFNPTQTRKQQERAKIRAHRHLVESLGFERPHVGAYVVRRLSPHGPGRLDQVVRGVWNTNNLEAYEHLPTSFSGMFEAIPGKPKWVKKKKGLYLSGVDFRHLGLKKDAQKKTGFQ